jgi:hypothetical protein
VPFVAIVSILIGVVYAAFFLLPLLGTHEVDARVLEHCRCRYMSQVPRLGVRPNGRETYRDPIRAELSRLAVRRTRGAGSGARRG